MKKSIKEQTIIEVEQLQKREDVLYQRLVFLNCEMMDMNNSGEGYENAPKSARYYMIKEWIEEVEQQYTLQQHMRQAREAKIARLK